MIVSVLTKYFQDVVIHQPKTSEAENPHGLVGLAELAKTDRILVQQVGGSPQTGDM